MSLDISCLSFFHWFEPEKLTWIESNLRPIRGKWRGLESKRFNIGLRLSSTDNPINIPHSLSYIQSINRLCIVPELLIIDNNLLTSGLSISLNEFQCVNTASFLLYVLGTVDRGREHKKEGTRLRGGHQTF